MHGQKMDSDEGQMTRLHGGSNDEEGIKPTNKADVGGIRTRQPSISSKGRATVIATQILRIRNNDEAGAPLVKSRP